MMPYSETFAITKILVQFTREDGKTEQLETQVVEREAAIKTYGNALQSGHTAVISYTQSPSESKKMLRIMLGNFPPRSKAYLQAQCAQQLDFEDLSYCFRIPMVFIPPYMGNKQTYETKGVNFKGQLIPQGNLPETIQNAHRTELMELISQPVYTRSNVLWDVKINIKSQAKLSRIASINHAIDVVPSPN